MNWIAVLAVALIGTVAHAYPNQERASVDVDLSQSVQFVISSDNQYLYIAYANTFKIFDTGTFALAATQPYAISADTTKYPGNYTGIIYFSGSNTIYLPMDNGIVLKFDLASVSTAPTIITLASGKKLGNGVPDTVGGDAIYVINSTDTSVIKYKISTAQSTDIPILPAVSAAGFAATPQLNQIVFSPQSSEAASEVYLTTTTNMLVFFNLGTLSPAITLINPTLNLTDTLQGVSPMPTKNYVYLADYTANTFAQVQISNHAVVGTPVSLTPNNQPNWLLITTVTNPTATYGYVAGVQGVSIFNTSDNDIIDQVTTNDDDNDPLSVSGIGPMLASTDGYVYISASSGNIGVVSDNPYVTVNSKTYSSGGSSLGVGGTVTINFKADEAGTYVIRSGGNVSGSGTVLVDSSGNASGTVAAANTAQDVVVPYNANSSAFQEGDNSVYFFVTDSTSNVGRRATTVTVDTPPLAVTVVGSSFGNTRAYINFSRLTANDINYYNIYADTDPVVVTTKTGVSATLAQGSDSTLTGTVSGLTNGTLYYLAIEGVDTAGNVGPRTSTFDGGALITATPQLTVGPAGYTGETGCGLLRGDRAIHSILAVLAVVVASAGALVWRRWRLRTLLILAMLLTASLASAQDILMNPPSEPSLAPIRKYGWYMDGRASLWQPTSSTTKLFFPSFFNWQGYLSGGFLYNEQIGAEVGVGIFYKTGSSLAAGSTTPSQDKFRLLTVPITIGGAYRFMYSRKMPVVPYVRGGFEMDYFHENDSGAVVQGLKKGLYGGAGLQVPISRWLDALDFEKHRDTQVYLIFEGQYKWVNDFGGRGLNLSGALYSAGFLVTF